MNVASLELCKELYELSGWGNEYEIDHGWYDYQTDGRKKPDTCVESFKELDHSKDHGDFFNGGYPTYLCPAYDLGYLMRKLEHAKNSKSEHLSLYLNEDGLWEAQYAGLSRYWQNAVSSEDAACKLCIELFKQGVLVTNPGK